MDERFEIFLGLLAGGGFGAVLGGVFGAMVGAITWSDGRMAGTALGLRVADLCGNHLAPGKRGAIVGAVDGFVFLGISGLLVTGVAMWQGVWSWRAVRPAGKIAVSLVLGALFFGLLARGMIRSGVRVLGLVFVISMAGAIAGIVLGGRDGLLTGVLLGVVTATLFGMWR